MPRVPPVSVAKCFALFSNFYCRMGELDIYFNSNGFNNFQLAKLLDLIGYLGNIPYMKNIIKNKSGTWAFLVFLVKYKKVMCSDDSNDLVNQLFGRVSTLCLEETIISFDSSKCVSATIIVFALNNSILGPTFKVPK